MNKRFTKALFISAVTLCGISAVTAQNDKERAVIIKATNVDKLKQLSEEFSEDYKNKRAYALQMAAVKGWPVEIEKKDGGTSLLVDVATDGSPMYITTTNTGVATTSRVTALQQGGASGLNLTGTGMIVGVWDGGFARDTHVDLVGRVFPADNSSGTIAFHPTHVTGTIIGSGAAHVNSKGMATSANVYMCDYANDFAEMSTLVSDGLILSNHSYGLDASLIPSWYFGSYISLSRQVDVIMFNAPYYQPCFSAGNDGNGDFDRLTDRSISKNGISVAATLQVNNYLSPSSVIIANFSSWGPTDDNRIKPDIATKGQSVRSASNTGDTNTGLSNGTSMSTPGITGALTLLQQHYKNLNGGNFMRSSTVRALVAHSADEAGDFPGPDAKFGWGLMNATKAAQVISKKATSQAFMDELVLLPGQTITRQFTAAETENLVLTMAWTDPPGQQNNGVDNNATPVLVNDLDIVVTKGTDSFYPWMLNPIRGEASIRGVNNVDNTEKIEISNPSGIYTVKISHKGNSLSNPGGAPSQSYSLIITGASNEVMSTEGFDKNFFELWPNPASDKINISFKSPLEDNALVKIYDVQGRQVINKAIDSENFSIDTSALASGIYMVQINNGTSVSVKKIVKK